MTTIAAPLTAPTEQRFQLSCVEWDLYEYLLDQIGDRHVFLTFNDGSIELMSPSYQHDMRGRSLGLLVNILAEELRIRIKGAGSTTFKRKDLNIGLEPDQCFYIANVKHLRGKTQLDLSVDPPPDLAIEVEVSRRMNSRMSLYAALGVPEIWRDDGTQVHVHVLGADGTYGEVTRSVSFPMLPMEQVNQFLDMATNVDEMSWTLTVRQWVKQNLVGKS